MSDLRQAREQAGLSLAEVAEKTRIPVRYLEALEKGDLKVFPPGPFIAGYTKQYRAFLGLPPPSAQVARPIEAPTLRPRRESPERTVTEPALPGPRSRARSLRLGVIGALSVASLVLAARIVGEIDPAAEPTLGVAPDQTVTVAVLEKVRARVEVDGRPTLDGVLDPGPARTFAGHDRVSLELETLDGVTVGYNGQKVVPLGARSLPRRLVFIDDAPGGR